MSCAVRIRSERAAGADIDAHGWFGETALFSLDEDAVRELIRHHVNLEARNDYGQTALIETVSGSIAEILIKAGSDINAKDKDGNPVRDADGNLQLRKRRLREAKPLQFIDDFKDVDPGLRAALLPPVLSSEGDETKDTTKWKDLFKKGAPRIVYAIVPVDCAGTRGQVR